MDVDFQDNIGILHPYTADDDFPDICSLRRHALQRSQDSGAVTDWSRGSPTRQSCKSQDSFLSDREEKYVTVLSVNGGIDSQATVCKNTLFAHNNGVAKPDFVTVLSIGEANDCASVSLTINNDAAEMNTTDKTRLPQSGFAEELAIVDRRKNEKLGFGLKFDGGSEKNETVKGLYIQCCADKSPASNVHCSWGALVESDEIIEICDRSVQSLSRDEIIHLLTEGPSRLTLKIRHQWQKNRRLEIIENILRPTCKPAANKARVAKRNSCPQERAVDVPVEFLDCQKLFRIKTANKRCDVHADDIIAPPVPPRRKRRSKLTLESIASATKSIIMRPSNSSEVTPETARIASIAPNKPPRIKLQQSKSLGFDSNCTPDFPSEMIPKKTVDESNRQSVATENVATIIINENVTTIETRRENVNEPLIDKPARAQVYIDLIAEEDKRLSSIFDGESESDTSSNVSTVVDCWSIISSNVPSSPSRFSISTHFSFNETGQSNCDSADVVKGDQLEGTDFLRGLLKENSAYMNRTFARFDCDAQHDSGVVIAEDEHESCSTVNGDIFRVIEPPETFLDPPVDIRDDKNDVGVLDDNGKRIFQAATDKDHPNNRDPQLSACHLNGAAASDCQERLRSGGITSDTVDEQVASADKTHALNNDLSGECGNILRRPFESEQPAVQNAPPDGMCVKEDTLLQLQETPSVLPRTLLAEELESNGEQRDSFVW